MSNLHARVGALRHVLPFPKNSLGAYFGSFKLTENLDRMDKRKALFFQNF